MSITNNSFFPLCTLSGEEQDLSSASGSVTMQEPSFSGMEGESLPYRMNNDWEITLLMFGCFFLIYYSLHRRRKYLFYRLKTFFVHKERGSLFDDAAGADIRLTAMLSGVTCILGGISLYDYFIDTSFSPVVTDIPSHFIIFVYIAAVLLLLLVKWVTYSFINWVFFDKERNSIWQEAYFDLFVVTGFLLFPAVLLIIYFNLSSPITFTYIFLVVIFTKILLFYKCIRNFFNRFHGFVHLILYFCSQEIIPDLFWWKGIEYINTLILNF